MDPQIQEPKPMILCFSNLDWGYLRYRKQHLMSRLSEYFQVIYVNPPRALKWKQPSRWNRLTQAGRQLWVYDPVVLPGIRWSSTLRGWNYRLIARFLRKARPPDARVAIWIYSPHAHPFIAMLKPDMVVYDVADNYTVPSGPALRDFNEYRELDVLARLEQKVLQAAHLVICVSEPLVEKAGAVNRNVRLVPNGCDLSSYSDASPPRERNGSRPRIGYIGTVAPRFDVELVIEIARRRPDWDLEIVGPVSPLVSLPGNSMPANIRWRGEVPYDVVPATIQSFDVGILPLQEIPFSYCSSPIQVWDYLAAGKPVVSTPIAQFQRLPELVATASGAASFAEAIEKSLNRDDIGKFQYRRRFADNNSWDQRVQQILRHLREAGFAPNPVL